MAGKFTFDLKARAVSTVVGGVPIDITPKNSPYSTDDAEVAAVLRELDGLKETTKGSDR